MHAKKYQQYDSKRITISRIANPFPIAFLLISQVERTSEVRLLSSSISIQIGVNSLTVPSFAAVAVHQVLVVVVELRFEVVHLQQTYAAANQVCQDAVISFTQRMAIFHPQLFHSPPSQSPTAAL
jgi:hypothetical protein